VVGHLPSAFFGDHTVEALREVVPHTPVVLYDLVYLPTRGNWLKYLKEGNPQYWIPRGGNPGMERYDWYLATSIVSLYPLLRIPQPCSNIGIRIADESLFPNQGSEFRALLDFERPGHMHERAVQVQALHELGIRYTVLTGSYDLGAIREIYRQTSIYFVAHLESFGLPICELQACGAKVFTPYSLWCPSHWIKDDLFVPGPGRLNANFVVYDNDVQVLKQRICEVRNTFDARGNVEEFVRANPALANGDMEQLRLFLERLASGKITSRSHLEYERLNDVIIRSNEACSF
jgi:hypothetical protein